MLKFAEWDGIGTITYVLLKWKNKRWKFRFLIKMGSLFIENYDIIQKYNIKIAKKDSIGKGVRECFEKYQS